MYNAENKWRAVRYGMDADFATVAGRVMPARSMARGLLEELRPLARDLGCEEELGSVLEIVELGTGAELAAGRAQEERLTRRGSGLPDRRHSARPNPRVTLYIRRYTSRPGEEEREGFERGHKAWGHIQDAGRAARGTVAGGGEVREKATDDRALPRAAGVGRAVDQLVRTALHPQLERGKDRLGHDPALRLRHRARDLSETGLAETIGEGLTKGLGVSSPSPSPSLRSSP